MISSRNRNSTSAVSAEAKRPESPNYFFQGVNMSRLMRTIGLLAVLTSLAWMSTTAQALVIDDFTSFQKEFDTTANGAGVFGSVVDGAVFKGNRDLYVEKTLPVGTSSDITAMSEAGAFSVNRDSGVGGNVLLQWDDDAVAPAAFDPESNLSFLLGGVDLTASAGIGIVVKILNAEVTTQTLHFTLWGADDTVASELALSLPSTAPPSYDLFFPFANFTAVGGKSAVNPASVNAITLAITGTNGADLTIDLVGTYAAPEPATAGMFGLSAVAILTRLRRKREVAVDTA